MNTLSAAPLMMQQATRALPGDATLQSFRETASKDGDREKLQKAANQLEGLFVNMMLAAMRKTIKGDSLMNGGQAEKIFTQMMDSEYADMAANNRSNFGIAEAIMKQYATRSMDTVDTAGGNETNPTLNIQG